jgi:hypothetical protein
MGGTKIYVKVLPKDMNGREHLGDLDINGRIILLLDSNRGTR